MTDWLDELEALPSERAAPVTRRACCFWCYKLDQDLPGFTQMGLMTNDIEEAGKQLTKIYGHPVEGLHKKEIAR